MVPIIGVIAGTGAIGPEIDDGSVVYLLAKPLKRPTIIFTKLIVAIARHHGVLGGADASSPGSSSTATASRSPSPTRSPRWSPRSPTPRCSCCSGTVTRHAVVFGLVYALVWEALFGSLVPGARTLSVQQWALAVGPQGRPAATWSPRTSD